MCLPARTRPPYQCFGVPGTLAVAFGFSVRRAPPLFVLSFGVCRRVCRHLGAVGVSVGGSVATWELSAIRTCLPDRPRPRLALFRRAWYPGGTVTVFPAVPARPFRAFVRSGFGGLERPSRIPIAVRSKFARRPESQYGLVRLRRRAPDPLRLSTRSINISYVANFTAGACARASRRLTPPLSDGGQHNIYVYLTK